MAGDDGELDVLARACQLRKDLYLAPQFAGMSFGDLERLRAVFDLAECDDSILPIEEQVDLRAVLVRTGGRNVAPRREVPHATLRNGSAPVVPQSALTAAVREARERRPRSLCVYAAK